MKTSLIHVYLAAEGSNANVREYVEGQEDWVAAGLPTESGGDRSRLFRPAIPLAGRSRQG